MDKNYFDFLVIGGGAAGVFSAITYKKKHPDQSVILVEKSAVLLSKVKVSGGGRCNVTHACFDPGLLCKNYPRGNKELRGPFHHFQPKDTIDWFESRGVKLKTEADGRMFPITDQSETIIRCLLSEADQLGVVIQTRQKILNLLKKDNHFSLEIEKKEPLFAGKVVLATGSNPDGYKWAQQLGHTIEPPVPSLFTFNVPTSNLKHLSGIALSHVEIAINESKLIQKGALLITHFGFSGPAILKLSAWGARYLHEKQYRVPFYINWVPEYTEEKMTSILLDTKKNSPQKILFSENPFILPKNLWRFFLEAISPEPSQKKWCDFSLKEIRALTTKIHRDVYLLEGKTTHKEEFVTCGGICLKEVNFKTMESKICPHLFFAGEILDIDGVTGGFNFQNAWTTAAIIANHDLS